ncbi:hypothetical protein ACIRQQ_07395 [Streptomyces fuscichromogenes]|uniref:hypothetical protein n=1 Tax=Streptomyces fuscichromogenes TaxID=1324013 RepID=UPI00381E23A7
MLSNDVLDAIDEIVPPGTDVNPADRYNATPPSIADPQQRRRGAWHPVRRATATPSAPR